MTFLNISRLLTLWLCVFFLAEPLYSSSFEDEGDPSSLASMQGDSDEEEATDEALTSEFTVVLAELSANLDELALAGEASIAKSEEFKTPALPAGKPALDEHELRLRSAGGDVQAMGLLAFRLERRYMESKSMMDGTEAFFWCSRAANEGYVVSMNDLSRFYLNGVGCDVSPDEAMSWIRKAVKTGNRVLDRLQLAHYLIEGIGCPSSFENKQEALGLFLGLALSGDKRAMLQVAGMLESGIGCKGDQKDQEEANAWYRKGADLGNVTCSEALATRLMLGKGCEVSDENRREAFSIFKRLSESGDEKLKAIVSYMLFYGVGCDKSPENVAEALKYIEPAAEAGDVDAMIHLAKHLLKDWCPGKYSPNDFRANQLLKRAADSKSAEACYAYGYCLQQGIGCWSRFVDKLDAHILFAEAALNDYLPATENVVYDLLFGTGCEDTYENKEEAFKLLSKGSFGNLPFKNYCLGYMYATGIGVKQNTKKALEILRPYQFTDGVCPLVLYVYLRDRNYQGALIFYELAQKQDANLGEDPRLVGYLKLKIRLSQQQVPLKKAGSKKGNAKKAQNYEFTEAAIKQDLTEVLRQYVDLREYLKNFLKISHLCKSMTINPRDLLDEMNTHLERFMISFKAAEDGAFKRIELNAFINEMSAIQEEVFLEGLKKEYAVIKDILASILRFSFQHGMQWADPFSCVK